MKRFVFFWIYIFCSAIAVNTYVSYMCIYPACFFRERTYVAQGLVNGVLNETWTHSYSTFELRYISKFLRWNLIIFFQLHGVFELLSSFSLLYAQRFGRGILLPSSGVTCWTLSPTQNFKRNPFFNPRRLQVQSQQQVEITKNFYYSLTLVSGYG